MNAMECFISWLVTVALPQLLLRVGRVYDRGFRFFQFLRALVAAHFNGFATDLDLDRLSIERAVACSTCFRSHDSSPCSFGSAPICSAVARSARASEKR